MATGNAARRNVRAEARRAAQRRQRLLLGAAGAGILVLAVVIAVFSAGESASRISVDEVARVVEVTGEDLTTLPSDSTSDPAVGRLAPTVRGTDFDGSARQVGGQSGPQIIVFMASWCPACQQELPQLTSWLDGGNLPTEVDLIAVSTFLDAGRPNWPPQDWFEEVGYPGPIIVDDAESTISRTFGLSGTPFWVAVDADGEVVRRASGLLSTRELEDLVAEVTPG